MEKYDVKELVEKIYELDVKVYEATGSTMGKVFPAGKDLSVKKMLKHLDEDKRTCPMESGCPVPPPRRAIIGKYVRFSSTSRSFKKT